MILSGCSAVRLAHLLWEQGVVGSNPATPTIQKKELQFNVTPFFVLCVFKCGLLDLL